MAARASPALAARRSTRRAAARSPLAIKSSARLSDEAISLGSRRWIASHGIMGSRTGAGGRAATGAAAGGHAATGAPGGDAVDLVSLWLADVISSLVCSTTHV